jgi:hypothetical protein
MPNPKGCRGEMARAMTGKGMVEEALKSYATANHAIAKLGKEGKGMTGKGMVEEALKSYATANHAIANFGKEGNGMTGNSPGWAGMRCRCRVRWRKRGKLVHGIGPRATLPNWGGWPHRDWALLPSPGCVPDGCPPVLPPPSDSLRAESGEESVLA